MTNNIGNFQETYVYQPLDLTKQQIRLITLEPGYPGSAIQCDIHVFDIETVPHYIALSYTWGPPTPTANIHIGKKRHEVRQNLYDFLDVYRNDQSNAHYIWVDQVCISQAHSGERNHQVGIMSDIYKQCLYVIIWLGTALQKTARDFSRGPSQSLACTILRNEYFTRLWIIQEVLLSPEARILCGEVWISFQTLVAALEDDQTTLRPIDFLNFVFRDYKRFPRFNDQGGLTLQSCLEQYATQKCGDPRNKVYGLLSLVREAEPVVIDYSKTKEEVFLDVVEMLRWQMPMQRLHEQHKRSAVSWYLCLSEHMGILNLDGVLEHFLLALHTMPEQAYLTFGFTEAQTVGEKGQWWYRSAICPHKVIHCSPVESSGTEKTSLPKWKYRNLS